MRIDDIKVSFLVIDSIGTQKICICFVLFPIVCTCVVHKRCHLEVVSQCPGVKQDMTEVFPHEEMV